MKRFLLVCFLFHPQPCLSTPPSHKAQRVKLTTFRVGPKEAQPTAVSCQLQPTHNDLPFPVPKVGDQRENLCSALSTTKIKPSVFSDFTELYYEDIYCNLGSRSLSEVLISTDRTSVHITTARWDVRWGAADKNSCLCHRFISFNRYVSRLCCPAMVGVATENVHLWAISFIGSMDIETCLLFINTT